MTPEMPRVGNNKRKRKPHTATREAGIIINGGVFCGECGSRAELVTGEVLYPHRPDLKRKRFWRCTGCLDSHVGCHPGSKIPLGAPSRGPLRRAKMEAHAAFDPIWRTGEMSRSAAYAWLANELGIPRVKTHIGYFDLKTCRRVVEVCRPGTCIDFGAVLG